MYICVHVLCKMSIYIWRVHVHIYEHICSYVHVHKHTHTHIYSERTSPPSMADLLICSQICSYVSLRFVNMFLFSDLLKCFWQICKYVSMGMFSYMYINIHTDIYTPLHQWQACCIIVCIHITAYICTCMYTHIHIYMYMSTLREYPIYLR